MTVLEFDAVIDEEGLIRVPEEIAAQLPRGQSLRLQVRMQAASAAEQEIAAMTPDEAWASILAFIDERMKQAATLLPGKPYKWRREDAYEHLEKYGPERDS